MSYQLPPVQDTLRLRRQATQAQQFYHAPSLEAANLPTGHGSRERTPVPALSCPRPQARRAPDPARLEIALNEPDPFSPLQISDSPQISPYESNFITGPISPLNFSFSGLEASVAPRLLPNNTQYYPRQAAAQPNSPRFPTIFVNRPCPLHEALQRPSLSHHQQQQQQHQCPWIPAPFRHSWPLDTNNIQTQIYHPQTMAYTPMALSTAPFLPTYSQGLNLANAQASTHAQTQGHTRGISTGTSNSTNSTDSFSSIHTLDNEESSSRNSPLPHRPQYAQQHNHNHDSNPHAHAHYNNPSGQAVPSIPPGFGSRFGSGSGLPLGPALSISTGAGTGTGAGHPGYRPHVPTCTSCGEPIASPLVSKFSFDSSDEEDAEGEEEEEEEKAGFKDELCFEDELGAEHKSDLSCTEAGSVKEEGVEEDSVEVGIVLQYRADDGAELGVVDENGVEEGGVQG